MKNIKAKHFFSAIFILLIFIVIIFNVNNKSDDQVDSYPPDENIHVNNRLGMTGDNEQKESPGDTIFIKTTLPEEDNENEKKIYINETYINNPQNLKLKALIVETVKKVEGVPQFVWEPVKFTENDINKQIDNLAKIIFYSNLVNLNHSMEDKRILSELIAEQIKEKKEHFESLCAEVRQKSMVRNDDDQISIEDAFRNCGEKIKNLDDMLNNYEAKY